MKGRREEGRGGIIYTVGRRRTYTPRSPPFVRCCCVTRGIATPCPYTRVYIYITSNVRENHLIAENPSKMGLRETAVGENIASNLRLYIFFFRLDVLYILRLDKRLSMNYDNFFCLHSMNKCTFVSSIFKGDRIGKRITSNEIW